MFMKELKLYLNYLKEEIEQVQELPSDNRLKYFETFRDNITAGIEYYKNLFANKFNAIKDTLLMDLTELETEFEVIKQQMILLDLLSESVEEKQTSLAVTN